MDDAVKAKLAEAGVDLESAMERFMNNDALLERFLKKFPADPNYQKLVDSMEADNIEDAFAAAHTLKGLCGNLSLAAMQAVVSEQTELLRSGKGAEAKEMMPQVTQEYEKIIAVIEQL